MNLIDSKNRLIEVHKFFYSLMLFNRWNKLVYQEA